MKKLLLSLLLTTTSLTWAGLFQPKSACSSTAECRDEIAETCQRLYHTTGRPSVVHLVEDNLGDGACSGVCPGGGQGVTRNCRDHKTVPYCGDGVCDGGDHAESCMDCSVDCGQCHQERSGDVTESYIIEGLTPDASPCDPASGSGECETAADEQCRWRYDSTVQRATIRQIAPRDNRLGSCRATCNDGHSVIKFCATEGNGGGWRGFCGDAQCETVYGETHANCPNDCPGDGLPGGSPQPQLPLILTIESMYTYQYLPTPGVVTLCSLP